MSRTMPDDIRIVLELPPEALRALTRVADALDRICPAPHELTPAEEKELADLDEQSAEDEQAALRRESELAAVERLELRGVEVPEAVYKRLGLAPPNRKLSEPPSAEVLDADQAELAKPPEPPKPPELVKPVDSDGIVSARKAGL